MNRLFFLKLFVLMSLLLATTPTEASNKMKLRNPVIFSDVPDIDVIRVKNYYYMVSTTMHLMPGVPIMRSKDLVNWEIISYVVNEIKDSPEYDLNGGNIYGNGQWATSLRYHNGKFYVLFATNRPQKTYIYATENPAGKWTKIMELNELHHDTSLFFDDDGKAYIAGGAGRVRLQQLNDNLSAINPNGKDCIIVDGGAMNLPGLIEGSHLCKYNGKYYLFMIWWPGGNIRTEVAFRADKIEGPYEHKVILHDDMDRKGAGVAQGCIVDTKDGRWFGYLFQDRGGVGRVPCIMPCHWIDGWPILGDEQGKVPTEMTYPLKPQKPTPLVISDEFKDKQLALNWQWNHNPDNNLWSLSARKGFLRLTTGKIVKSIFEARNTLSQRTEGPACSATTKLDVTHMKNGDHTGISAFCSDPGILEIEMSNATKYLVMKDCDTEKERIPLTSNTVYLRMDCDFNNGRDIAQFFYSIDGNNWNKIGNDFHMVFNLKHFMGNRISLFNYATQETGGYVDFDFFHYQRKP